MGHKQVNCRKWKIAFADVDQTTLLKRISFRGLEKNAKTSGSIERINSDVCHKQRKPKYAGLHASQNIMGQFLLKSNALKITNRVWLGVA